jgi:hypothetical protein
VTVALDMCGDRVYKITIAHAQAKWFNALVELRTKLIDQNGAQWDRLLTVPVNCRSDEQIVGCFDGCTCTSIGSGRRAKHFG